MQVTKKSLLIISLRVDPEEYDSIEEYELEHGTYNSPRRKKYGYFDDDYDMDDED